MTLALLQAQGGGGSFLISLMPFFLIFGVFYFLIIMPQRKRQQQLKATIDELKAGARIVTTGGIVATVTAVRETTLLVRTADKSMLEITRGAVAGLFEGGEGS
ncbi:MAG: preprotein translocase subunit YajC [Acidobacteriota bacterium]|jgi:preprotein translocase subunit YajC|nr:preprotein translocase subunit YajC [Acidobacteriota bacterium]